jgi:hypothetical protein
MRSIDPYALLRRVSGNSARRLVEEGQMRCFLMRGGHIVSVRELSTVLSDEEAIEQCRLEFEKSRQYFDDFEVWQRTRKVYQHSLDKGLLAFSSKRAPWP